MGIMLRCQFQWYASQFEGAVCRPLSGGMLAEQ
jgi:hypothetical protein